MKPAEVRIDATKAEVDVDIDRQLQYATQLFCKFGGVNAARSDGSSAALAANFPGSGVLAITPLRRRWLSRYGNW